MVFFKFKYDLDNITLHMLSNYLIHNNWNIDTTFKNKKLLLFKKYFDDDIFSIAIPSNEKFTDYKKRLEESINMLSELNDTTPDFIINDINNYNNKVTLLSRKNSCLKGSNDKLSFRIISEISNTGSIPFDYATNVVDGLKRLLLSAIYAESNPLPYINSSNKNSAIELSKYKFAQTDLGSFIFNIEIDLDSYNTQLAWDQYENELYNDDNYTVPTRKVIKRIQNGIQSVSTAISNNTIEELYSDGYINGLNANMCDAILNFKHSLYEIDIESTVTWSNSLPIPTGIVQRTIIKDNDFKAIDYISKKYKEREISIVQISGIIINLHNSFDENNRFDRYIIIDTLIENKKRKVKIPLNSFDYSKACEAHRTKSTVSVNGQLDKIGRYWTLISYENFIVNKKG
jgi:hypothetical protein